MVEFRFWKFFNTGKTLVESTLLALFSPLSIRIKTKVVLILKKIIGVKNIYN